MGRKNNAPLYTVWSAVDSTAPQTSSGTNVAQIDHVTIDLSYQTTVVASFSVEYSNDHETTPPAQWVWHPVDFGGSGTIALDGAIQTETEITFEFMPYKNLRLKLANNGGTGTISAVISGQTRGA